MRNVALMVFTLALLCQSKIIAQQDPCGSVCLENESLCTLGTVTTTCTEDGQCETTYSPGNCE